MGQDSASVRSRSNSDALNIRMILNNTSMSPEARMHAVMTISNTWAEATAGSTARYKALKDYEARKANGTLYGEL